MHASGALPPFCPVGFWGRIVPLRYYGLLRTRSKNVTYPARLMSFREHVCYNANRERSLCNGDGHGFRLKPGGWPGSEIGSYPRCNKVARLRKAGSSLSLT